MGVEVCNLELGIIEMEEKGDNWGTAVCARSQERKLKRHQASHPLSRWLHFLPQDFFPAQNNFLEVSPVPETRNNCVIR